MSDLISRQAAINTVKKHYRVDNDLLEVIVYQLENLPSTQPEPCEDVVSRAEAIRICKERGHDNSAYYIEQLPSAQPEIVRCKECANYDTDWTSEMVPDRHYCLVMDGMMPKDGFCHKAERRTDEGD